ncbi:unnamed protein product [Lampetra fluviatilis]
MTPLTPGPCLKMTQLRLIWARASNNSNSSRRLWCQRAGGCALHELNFAGGANLTMIPCSHCACYRRCCCVKMLSLKSSKKEKRERRIMDGRLPTLQTPSTEPWWGAAAAAVEASVPCRGGEKELSTA